MTHTVQCMCVSDLVTMETFKTLCFVFICLPLLHYCTALREQEGISRSEPHCPDRCSCSRYLKRVSCIGQQLRSIPDDIPHSVTQLYLSHNLLTEIQRGAFQNLTSLTSLSLECNLIVKIADGAFVGLNNLTNLYLKKNQLTRLSSEVFWDLCSMSYLYLSQNKLVQIPDLRYAQNLIYLTLDNNNLERAFFPVGFRNLSRLSTVVLSNNPKLTQIRGVDFSALNHSTVRKIAVSRCGLNDIEDRVFNFPRLQSLSLSYNVGWNESLFRRVLSSLVNCSELTSLDLSGVISLPTLPANIFSSLASVPLIHLNLAHTTDIAVVDNGTFQYFPVLEMLDLSRSDFSIIQDTMSQMKKLQTLNLAHNKQLRLVPVLDLPSLQVLDISHCTSVQELKQMTFLELPVLSSLVLHDCGIHRIYKDTFLGLNRLKTLDLSHNVVGSSSFPVDLFSPLTQLTKLDLSNNNVKQVITETDLFKHLQLLTDLDLSGNGCSMLPEEIFNPLTSLISLDLSRNSLGGGVISRVSGGKLLQGLAALERIMLMENNIYELPFEFFDDLLSLRMVNLSNNHLDRWNGSAFNGSANMSLIDLSGNKITAVPKSSITSLAPSVKLNLTDNPFACWCDLIWFRNWITSHNVTDEKLPGLESYKCSSPLAMANKPLLDFDPETIMKWCSPPPWMIITVSVGSGVAVIIVFLVLICYRYRWPIRLKIYKMKRRMRRDPGYDRMDEEPENVYDVYVSYGPSVADENWVRETLMPVIDIKERARLAARENDANVEESLALENIREFLRVNAYWEKRDMLPGSSKIGAISDAIYGSRKVMLVVSSEYVRDGRRAYEIEMAVDKSCSAHRQLEDIVIVLLDKEAALQLPAELRTKIEDALEWTPDDQDGQELFWRRLQDLLHADDVPLLNV